MKFSVYLLHHVKLSLKLNLCCVPFPHVFEHSDHEPAVQIARIARVTERDVNVEHGNSSQRRSLVGFGTLKFIKWYNL